MLLLLLLLFYGTGEFACVCVFVCACMHALRSPLSVGLLAASFVKQLHSFSLPNLLTSLLLPLIFLSAFATVYLSNYGLIPRPLHNCQSLSLMPPSSKPLNEQTYLSLIGLRENRNKQRLRKYRGELLPLLLLLAKIRPRRMRKSAQTRAELWD